MNENPCSPVWVWTRFHTDSDDWRPIYDADNPPKALGPYWQSGLGEGYSIICAWIRVGTDVRQFWPEATHIDASEPSMMTFTDRFPKPDWWTE